MTHNPFHTPQTHHRRHSSSSHVIRHGARLLHSAVRHLHRTHAKTHHRKPSGGTHIEQMKGDDIHSGFTDASYTVVVAEPKKNVDYKAGKNLYTEINAGRCASLAGGQNVQTITTIGTTSEWLVNSGTATNHFGAAKIGVCLFNSNYNQYIIGSAAYPDQGKKVATDKFHLSSCNLKVSLANFENIPVSVWIYVLECKMATNFPPNALWERDLSLANVTGQYPPAANSAPGLNSGGTIGIDAAGVVNETPGSCPNFSKVWKIKKVHRANLSAAAQEDIDFHIKMHQTGDLTKFVAQNPSFTIEPSTWTEANIAVQYPRGSVAVMHVARAGVIRDITGGSDAITYGPVSVGVVTTKGYSMYPMKAGASRFDAKVVYPQLPYNVAEANTSFMNVVDEPKPARSA